MPRNQGEGSPGGRGGGGGAQSGERQPQSHSSVPADSCCSQPATLHYTTHGSVSSLRKETKKLGETGES